MLRKNFWSGSLAKALWKSNISLTLSQNEKSLAPKLNNWRPFKLQNSNGREPHPSNFGNQPIF